MKKMMTAIALAMGVVGFGLIAEEAAKTEEKAKTVAEMSVEELKDLHAKKVAALADEKDEAKKAAIQAEIDSIKKALEEKGVKEEKEESKE